MINFTVLCLLLNSVLGGKSLPCHNRYQIQFLPTGNQKNSTKGEAESQISRQHNPKTALAYNPPLKNSKKKNIKNLVLHRIKRILSKSYLSVKLVKVRSFTTS